MPPKYRCPSCNRPFATSKAVSNHLSHPRSTCTDWRWTDHILSLDDSTASDHPTGDYSASDNGMDDYEFEGDGGVFEDDAESDVGDSAGGAVHSATHGFFSNAQL
jgi:hypothetical protein